MLVATNIQLNHFELAILEYINRNPDATSRLALEKTRVEQGSGQIAIRYLGRLGLINIGDGSRSDKRLSVTARGVELLRQNGLLM
jgi:DNA-binding MarR family transcriptional regulator